MPAACVLLCIKEFEGRTCRCMGGAGCRAFHGVVVAVYCLLQHQHLPNIFRTYTSEHTRLL